MQALSSDKFVDQIARLHETNAVELAALKTQTWIDKSSRLLGLENDANVIGYMGVTNHPVARLNYPLVAKLNRGMAEDIVRTSSEELLALPSLAKDTDFLEASMQLVRSAATFGSVNKDYVGLKESWGRFFDELQRPVYEKLPGSIEDDTRKALFEALSSVVSGNVPAILSEHETQLESANQALYNGDPARLGKLLYQVVRDILDIKAPEPPPAGSSGTGDGSEGGEGEGDGDDENGAGEGPNFSVLAAFVDSLNPDKQPAPKKLSVPDMFSIPTLPGIDVEKLKLIEDTKADLVMPEALPGFAYFTHKTRVAQGAREAYNQQVHALREPIKRIRNIIEEFYRTNTIIEYGQKSGRPDAARLHKSRLGSLNVFRRQHVDSVGHAHVVVLLDESGSMGSGIRSETNDMPRMNTSGLNAYISDDPEQVVLGNKISPIYNNRVAIAKNMAMMLLEASRHLPGFKVEVAGYSSVASSILGPLKEIGEAASKANGHSSERYYGAYVPMVRMLGDSEEPYSVMSTAALHENADIQAFHWARERLKNSSSAQKAILYLADGQIIDGADLVQKQLDEARRYGISTFFMDLSHGQARRQFVRDDGKANGLYAIPHQEVRTFDDMLKGLKRFLDDLVRMAG